MEAKSYKRNYRHKCHPSKNKTIKIIDGVLKPGAIAYKEGMTLEDLIEAAGGLVNRKATNDIRLYRNSKVYTYSWNKPLHRTLKIHPDDIWEAIEK